MGINQLYVMVREGVFEEARLRKEGEEGDSKERAFLMERRAHAKSLGQEGVCTYKELNDGIGLG